MFIKVATYNQKAEKTGEMEVSGKIFGIEAKNELIHQAMVAQMSNERQVLAHTKDRGEVRGGGRKPWKQKGTGRARAGSSRSPIWIGGGVTFGPRNDRNFKKDLNRKMKQKAIKMVMSDRLRSGNLVVINDLSAEEYKTKKMDAMISLFENSVYSRDNQDIKKEKRSILFVNDKKDEMSKISTRNLSGVKYINMENINILDLLKYKYLVMTEASIKKIEEQYSK